MATYNELRKINVNDKTEKKGKFTYLSWAWAVDQLLQLDQSATWEYKFFDNMEAGQTPYCQIGDTAMVFCTVTAFGKSMTAQLPVLNSSNKAIANPTSMDINTAMQRCLAKAIALHGLGIYIYAGEDLPTGELDGQLADFLAAIDAASDIDELKSIYMQATRVLPKEKDAINAATNSKKASLS